MRKDVITNKDAGTILDGDMRIWSRHGTFVIFLVLLAVYIAYHARIVTTIPCGGGVLDGVVRSFTHISTPHFLANLAGIYLLYRAEVQVGTSKFLRVFFSILVLSVGIEILFGMFFNCSCSIGFSGVLFGFASWSLFTEKEVNYSLLVGLVGLITVTSVMRGQKVSTTGHVAGFLAGILTAISMGNVNKVVVPKNATF